jgi:hypothetical protein
MKRFHRCFRPSINHGHALKLNRANLDGLGDLCKEAVASKSELGPVQPTRCQSLPGCAHSHIDLDYTKIKIRD